MRNVAPKVKNENQIMHARLETHLRKTVCRDPVIA